MPAVFARPIIHLLYGHEFDAAIGVLRVLVLTLPLTALATREPAVWAALTDALARLERHYRDACHVEFTYESGQLWLLQVRPGGLTAPALVRVAVDLADERLISRAEAVRRITPRHLRAAVPPR